MSVSREFLDHLADQLRGFGPYAVRRMFGGAGLFRGPLMFGLVSGTCSISRSARPAATRILLSAPSPSAIAGGTAFLTSYYEVPAEVLDDPDMLARWACRAWEAARSAAKPKQAAAKSAKGG